MGSRAAEVIKRALPPRRWRAIRRATNRLRWVLKFRLMRQYGFPVARRPLRALQYVLWDPEVESYSYDVANTDEMAAFLAPLLGTSREQVGAWMHEALTDPLLTRDRGFHWSSKRRQPPGNRLLWYPVVRALKPRLVVEAGTHEGLGAELILVALRRNAAEGAPGRLLSLDIHEDTGWLVAPELRANWEFVLASTLDGLEPALRGREVDLFVHETPHVHEFIDRELDVALRHARERLVVIDTSGQTCTATREICQRLGGEHHYFHDRPLNHIVRSLGTNVALFDAEAIRAARGTAGDADGKPEPRASHGAVSGALAKSVLALSPAYEWLGSACEFAFAAI